MKRYRKMLSIIIILNTLIIQLSYLTPKAVVNNSNILIRPVNAGVLLYSFEDIFLSLIRKNLEDIQKENEDKIKFTFFDGKSNNAIQYENIDRAIQGNFDFLVLNMSENRKEVREEIFTKLKRKSIPVIIFTYDIPESSAFISNNKAFVLNTDQREAGNIQGKLVADTWNTNKGTMDKNKDGIMQYVMLRGVESTYTELRTKSAIDRINNSGIKTQELASVDASWSKELAKNAISSLFLKYGNKIEVIISNNDAMAIGAIEALQQYGYNKENKLRTIPIFGIDAIQEAKALIEKGYMAGSVFQDPVPIVKAIYDVGMNLVSDKNPVEGTNLELNGKEIIVPLVFKPYTVSYG